MKRRTYTVSDHLYAVRVQKYDMEITIDVHAKNRNQAAAKMKRCGWEVCWVNMIG
jgi:hypothetical protein